MQRHRKGSRQATGALEDDRLVSCTAYPEGESLWKLCEPLIAWSDGHVESLKRTEANLRTLFETVGLCDRLSF